MPSKTTKAKASADLRKGKSASTAAGEYVREEIHHIREGKHGARNAKQAIAIGLSKARRAGVKAEPAESASKRVKTKAAQETRRAGKKVSRTRSRASTQAAKREPRAAASSTALSRHAKASAERRRKAGGANSPKAAAKRAATTRKRTSTRSSTRRRTKRASA